MLTFSACTCKPFRLLPAALGSLLIFAAGPALAEEGEEAPRPNFLIILADDAGFSDTGRYGGEIQTPTLDRLAEEGVRFTQFTSAARCWPSRAALLTGYYAQQVRMDPPRGQMGGMPPWGRMLPQYLEQAGYRSYHSGKWHIHVEDNPVEHGRFDRSYRTKDHNRYFWQQDHYLDDQPLPPVERGEDYYKTTAMAEYTIDFLQEHAEEHEGEPWFTYLAFTAPHFPLHAPEEDIARYRGVYEEGWDVIRERRLERLKEEGIVPADTPLPPLEPNVVPHWTMYDAEMEARFGPVEDRQGPPWVDQTLEEVYGPNEVGRAVAWDSLSAEQQAFQAEKMAIHAAMMDRMDREIGRVLEQVEAMGDLENTVVMYMSDNGATAEMLVRGDGHDPEAPMGSGQTYLCLGAGWSTAANTPFRLHKHWTHEGGAASPLIVSWPAGLEAAGELRHTPGHFVDVLPTLLELAGVPAEPLQAQGPPLPGRSLVPAFNEDAAVERDGLFYQHDGNRALREGDWKLVSRNGDHDEWELYNLAEDRNEMNDLAGQMPERVQAMGQRWEELAGEYERQATREYDGE